MQAFAPATLLAVWEAGRRQHPLDRALTLLGAAAPEATRDELAELSIGERDARLLHLRTQMLGSRANAFTACPSCGEQIEVPLDTTAFSSAAERSAPNEFRVEGSYVRFRLPNSRDLADAATRDNGDAVTRFVSRCILEIDPPNESLSIEKLSAALGDAILSREPQTEISLNLVCPACEQRWQTHFDIAKFFWKEIAAAARRLLREIDCLARAYGWSEGEILSLAPQRRETYLELIAG